MAIYETSCAAAASPLTYHRLSFPLHNNSFLLKTAMDMIFAGPQQLLPLVRRGPYERGSNHGNSLWSGLTLQASLSITLWCLGLIVAVSGKGVLMNATHHRSRKQKQQHTTATNTTSKASRVVAAFLRNIVVRAVPTVLWTKKTTGQPSSLAADQCEEDDLTSVMHTGSCQCGSVQFQVCKTLEYESRTRWKKK
jgi:hypothetical protein